MLELALKTLQPQIITFKSANIKFWLLGMDQVPDLTRAWLEGLRSAIPEGLSCEPDLSMRMNLHTEANGFCKLENTEFLTKYDFESCWSIQLSCIFRSQNFYHGNITPKKSLQPQNRILEFVLQLAKNFTAHPCLGQWVLVRAIILIIIYYKNK